MTKMTHTLPIINPPAHLSVLSKSLWQRLVPARIKTAERIVLLQSALETLDRLNDIRLHLTDMNLTLVTKKTGAIHINPLVKVEIELRTQFWELWRRLGLHDEKPTLPENYETR